MTYPTHETLMHQRAINAGLTMRSGLSVIDANAPDHVQQEQARDAERGHEFRDIGLPTLCRECLAIEGVDVGRVSRLELCRTATSTAALGSILSSVVGAHVAKGFLDAADSTEGWVSEVFDRPNFQSSPALILTSADKLARLDRGDTAQHASIPGEAESYAVARYARSMVVSDEDLADDNMGALVAVPARLGAAAAELRADLIYSIMLGNEILNTDSVALFNAAAHANHAVAGSTLSEVNLQTGISAVAKQKDSSGADLNLVVSHLIVPVSLKLSAAKLLRTFMLDDSEQIHLRTDSRLDNSVVDPRDDTKHAANGAQWFLAAGGGGRTIEVGYLGPTRAPDVRSYILRAGRWGLGWDVKLDIGAKALSHLGLYKADGTV